MRRYCLIAAFAIMVARTAGAAGVGVPPNYLESREPARYALVVANPTYANLAPLPSAKLDAERMRAQLAALNFDVTLELGLPSVEHFEDQVLPKFRSKLNTGDIVVFYFSGHGFSYGANNFLAPANVPKTIPTADLTVAAIAVESLEDYLGKRSPGVMLFVLDSCRSIAGFVVDDNTPEGYISKGLADPVQPKRATNVMYAFASRPGSPALTRSEPGEMSIFTGSLSEHIGAQHLEFGSIFRNVSAQVVVRTQGDQHPGIANWSDSDLYFVSSDILREQQKKAWLAALSGKNRTEIATFLRRFAASPYADAARRWLKDHSASTASESTSDISPWAVERAWQRRLDTRNFSIAFAPVGIAFANDMVADAYSSSLSTFPDRELGILPPIKFFGIGGAPKLQWMPDALAAHRDIVTTKDFVARYRPSKHAAMYTTLAAGTPLSIQRIEAGPSGETWLAVSARDGIEDDLQTASNFYIAVSSLYSSQSTKLGSPLSQIEVRPAVGPLRELLAEDPIKQAIVALERAGKSVTWAAIATAPVPSGPDQRREELVLSMRRTHASYLLRGAGVDGKAITSTAGVPGIAQDAVRIRFFGN